MRTVIKSLILAAGVILLSSCVQKPISTTAPENNTTYRVDYLFEHEGCKVYRFEDRGNYVYFTNRTGEVTGISADSSNQRVITIIKEGESR